MNNEPIQFLPVNRFWNQRQRMPVADIVACLALGVCIGFAVAWVMFALLFT